MTVTSLNVTGRFGAFSSLWRTCTSTTWSSQLIHHTSDLRIKKIVCSSVNTVQMSSSYKLSVGVKHLLLPPGITCCHCSDSGRGHIRLYWQNMWRVLYLYVDSFCLILPEKQDLLYPALWSISLTALFCVLSTIEKCLRLMLALFYCCL